MKIKAKFLYIIGIFILQLAISSCVNDSNKDKTKINLVELDDESEPVDEKIFYRFPSPEEIFKYIKSTDLQFNKGALNNVGTYKNYMGVKKQAINLGIYISDLAYITMFEQHEASLEYFMAIHKLSEELNISAAYSEPLVNRIGGNMDNADSLVVIAGDAYNNIVDYLVEHEQEDILAYISTGALIESLYLTLDYVDTYDKDNEIIKKVLNQKYVVNNLTEYVRQNQKDEEINKDLEKLNALFLALESTETKTTVEKTKSNKLIIGGGSELTINSENFLVLKNTILQLRLNFIKLN